MLCFWVFFGCNNNAESPLFSEEKASLNNFACVEAVSEFRKGDILVRPNANFLPGSSFVKNGFGFGHAVLVTQGFEHENTDSLLAGIVVVESMAAKVHQDFQVREIKGFVEHSNPAFSNVSFHNKYKGNRYRLRLGLNEPQIDSIIAFALSQKGSRSCWNAMKRFPENYEDSEAGKMNWADNHDWYCSLLVWQAVFYVTGIDLDVNGGYQVYPNDLVNHPLFDNTSEKRARVRF